MLISCAMYTWYWTFFSPLRVLTVRRTVHSHKFQKMCWQLILWVLASLFQTTQSVCYSHFNENECHTQEDLKIIVKLANESWMNSSRCVRSLNGYLTGFAFGSMVDLLCVSCSTDRKMRHVFWTTPFHEETQYINPLRIRLTTHGAEEGFTCSSNNKSIDISLVYDCSKGTEEIAILNSTLFQDVGYNRKLLRLQVIFFGTRQKHNVSRLVLERSVGSNQDFSRILESNHFNITRIACPKTKKASCFEIWSGDDVGLRLLQPNTQANLTIEEYSHDRKYCWNKRQIDVLSGIRTFAELISSEQASGVSKIPVVLLITTVAVVLIAVALIAVICKRRRGVSRDPQQKKVCLALKTNAKDDSNEATELTVLNNQNWSHLSSGLPTDVGITYDQERIENPNSGARIEKAYGSLHQLTNSAENKEEEEAEFLPEEGESDPDQSEVSRRLRETISEIQFPWNQQTLPFLLDSAAVNIGRLIGKGRFGNVYIGMVGGERVAIKVPKGNSAQDIVMAYEHGITELRVLGYLNQNPNQHVIQAMGFVMNPSYMLVLTYFQDGTLEHYLRNTSDIQLSEQILIGLHVALGCQHLIRWGILHRDVATRNVLIRLRDHKYDSCVLSDFSLAQKIQNHAASASLPANPSHLVNKREAAPETLANGEFSQESEVYSYGLLLWQVFAGGELPFNYLTEEELNRRHKSPLSELRPTIPNSCPTDIQILLNSCWELHPIERPNFCQIIDWLNTAFGLYDTASGEMENAATMPV